MNILIVHCGKGIYGGAELVIVELSKYLTKNGNAVVVVAKDIPHGMDWELINEDVAVQQVSSYFELRDSTQKLLGWADVINVHNFPATLTTFPTRMRNKSVVYMCNEPAELFTNWKRKPIEAFNRWWVKSSGMGVVVADQMNAERFKRIYKVEPKIVPYGVDYEFWSQGERIYRRDGTVLLQVGTISPYKNQLESIKTIEMLMGEMPYPITLHLIGSISDKGYYDLVMNYASSYGLQVEHHNHLSPEDIRGWYNYADVLLHPIRGQGGWLVPFEAMCTGLPVITTPSFSASGLIKKNRLGVVSTTMDEVISERRYKSLDTDGIKFWIKENLTWEKYGEGMLNAYQENIGK